MPCRLGSCRGGLDCSQQFAKFGDSGAGSRIGARSLGDLAGGSYVNGIFVNPQGRTSFSFPPLTSAFRNGGPVGSTATIPLIAFGRLSAINQPSGDPDECVTIITGPILSSN